MTALRQVEAPTGLLPGDHVCGIFADAAGFSAAVLPFLDEGRRRGEHLLVVGESRAALLTPLAGLPERDALLASGRLEVDSIAARYDVGLLDPVAQVQVFRRAARTALDGGRAGLRVAADVSALARGGREQRRRLHLYEGLVDELHDEAAVTGMCLYGASLGTDVLGPLAMLHPVHQGADPTSLGYLSRRGRDLKLRGEVDLSVADDLFAVVRDLACASPGEVVLDLSELEFLDVAGARTLRRAAELLAGAGVRLRLVGARRLVARSLRVFDLPAEEAIPA